MSRARSPFLVLITASLISLFPALILLDWLVERSGRRSVRLEGELRVRLGDHAPLFLPLTMTPGDSGATVVLTGAAMLRHDRYPWEPTGHEGTFRLELTPELLTNPRPGSRKSGFYASFASQRASSTDPPAPLADCSGQIFVEELGPPAPTTDLSRLSTLNLRLDLRCDHPGQDQRRGTADDRVWTISGPIQLVSHSPNEGLMGFRNQR